MWRPSVPSDRYVSCASYNARINQPAVKKSRRIGLESIKPRSQQKTFMSSVIPGEAKIQMHPVQHSCVTGFLVCVDVPNHIVGQTVDLVSSSFGHLCESFCLCLVLKGICWEVDA